MFENILAILFNLELVKCSKFYAKLKSAVQIDLALLQSVMALQKRGPRFKKSKGTII